jgi:hypothetical protein
MVKHRSGTRWPDDAVTLCAVYTMHKEKRSVGFLVKPQNQGRWFVIGLASKSLGRFVLKTTTMVCQWFGQTVKRLGDAVCSLHYAQGEEEHTFFG